MRDFDELKTKAWAQGRLFQVEMDLTHLCNAKCFFAFKGTTI